MGELVAEGGKKFVNKLVGNQEGPCLVHGSFQVVAYVSGRRMERNGFYSEACGGLIVAVMGK